MTSTTVIHISQKEIEKQSFINFENVPGLKGIALAHIIRVIGNKVEMRKHAKDENSNILSIDTEKVSKRKCHKLVDDDDFAKGIIRCQESLDDEQCDKFYCFFYVLF